MSGVLQFPGPEERFQRLERRLIHERIAEHGDPGFEAVAAEGRVVDAALDLLHWAEEQGDLSALPPAAMALLDQAQSLQELREAMTGAHAPRD